jgi:hypothetical protein
MTRDARLRYVESGIALILNLYAISLMVSIPYYNWQYAREHSFSDWLIWGEFAPTVKAFAWPYFAMQRAKSREMEPRTVATSREQIADVNILSAIRAVNRAISADVQGTHLMNATSELSTSERSQRVVAYAQQSLQVADGADEETLNKLYPDFGTRLKRDFAEAQRLRILGLTNRSESDFSRSQELSATWRDWYDRNRRGVQRSDSMKSVHILHQPEPLLHR